MLAFLYFAIPIASIIFFVYSLLRFLKAKRGGYIPEEIKKWKVIMIVSAVFMGVILTVVIGFAALLMLAIAYM